MANDRNKARRQPAPSNNHTDLFPLTLIDLLGFLLFYKSFERNHIYGTVQSIVLPANNQITF
jgi:hypothetical protein